MEDTERNLLRCCWFPIARLSDLDDGPVEANILGTELVVYRSGAEVTVAAGRCPHRGVALWLGVQRDGNLECPYHGWLFAPGTGRCVKIPALPSEASSSTPIALRTYPSKTAYGHVWACLDEPYLAFPQMLGYGADGWQYAFGDPHDLACGMRQLTENFRDMAHFPFVHTGTMGPNVRHEVDPYDIESVGWDLEWSLTTDLGGTALEGNAALANQQTLTYRVSLPMVAYVRTSFPDGGGRFVAQFATPINAEGTRVRQFWVVGIDPTVVGPHGVTLDEMWQYEKDIFEEDYPIVENQWPPEAPLDLHSQVHTRSDKYALVYRRRYQELLSRFTADGGNGHHPTPQEELAL